MAVMLPSGRPTAQLDLSSRHASAYVASALTRSAQGAQSLRLSAGKSARRTRDVHPAAPCRVPVRPLGGGGAAVPGRRGPEAARAAGSGGAAEGADVLALRAVHARAGPPAAAGRCGRGNGAL